MASIENTQPRMLVCPAVKPPTDDEQPFDQSRNPLILSPGHNKVDPRYWNLIKNSRTIVRWGRLKLIKYHPGKEIKPMPAAPGRVRLRTMSEEELTSGMNNEELPMSWRGHFREELKRRQKEREEGTPPESNEQPTLVELLAMNAADLIEVIGLLDDEPLLQSIGSQDGRSTVKQAVERRIQQINQ